ncbi:toluene tolerance protein [Acetobacter sp. LMG 1627]|uniref:Toluene tolerance protein n=1 Tax=Acetobacter conturbans TaxID=1737472 RepID=A0ABX0K6I8_9PROT|nr:toluene tolerance protein [Acetobacter conturbans]
MLPRPRDLARLWREDRRTLLHELLLLFIGLGFLLPNEPIWSDVFYVGILPLFVCEWWKGRFRAGIEEWPKPLLAGGLLIGSFLFGTVLHMTSTPLLKASLFWMWNMACTGTFVFLLADAFCATRVFRERLMQVMIGFGAVNVLIALGRLAFRPLEWQGHILRMQGWGLTRHPILGAIIMGSVLLMAVHRGLATSRWRYWLAAVAALIFILLTGSRGPLLGVLCALPVMLGLKRPKVALGLAVAAMVAVAAFWVLDGSVVSRLVKEQLGRGDSHRLTIWSLSWQQIRQAFWFGHGPAWKLARPGETFPHNLFLSTWLYAGLAGVGALLAYLVMVGKSLFEARHKVEMPLCLAVLIHTLVSAMTDFGQVIKGPAPMWYIFWLATLFSAYMAPRGRRKP